MVMRMTGVTKDRPAQIRRFQEGEVGVFLISLKAGGTGLNLTAADTVIHYDPCRWALGVPFLGPNPWSGRECFVAV